MAIGNNKNSKNPKLIYLVVVFRNNGNWEKRDKKEGLYLYGYSGLSIKIKVLLLKFEFSIELRKGNKSIFI